MAATAATAGRAIDVVLRPGDPVLILRASRRDDGTGWVATVCVDAPASGHPVTVAVFAGDVAVSPSACLGNAVRHLIKDADTGVPGRVDRVRQRLATG